MHPSDDAHVEPGAPYVVGLDAGTLREFSRTEIGGKACGLVELAASGEPIPRSLCITTTAYREHCARAGLDALLDPASATTDHAALTSAIRRRIIETPVAEPIRAAIRRGLARLRARRTAVRSSATTEDLPQGAFAGLYDTVLNVDGGSAGAVIDTVRRCWASLWSERAWAYRERLGFPHREAAMAVIVQELIAAHASGVLFTIDPRDGNPEVIVIEAVWGLGEALVSGRARPDRFVMTKGTHQMLEREIAPKESETVPADGHGIEVRAVESLRARAPAASDSLLRDLAARAESLERRSGTPLDIEWAAAGGGANNGRACFLQARPVSALDGEEWLRPPLPPGTVLSNVNAREVIPDVVTPATYSLLESVESIFGSIFGRLGIDLAGHRLTALYRGRAYFNLNTIAGVLACLPRAATRGLDLRELLGGMQQDSTGGDPFAIPREHVARVRGGWLSLLVHFPGLVLWTLFHPLAAGERFLRGLGEQRRALTKTVDSARDERALLECYRKILRTGLESDGALLYPGRGGAYFLALATLCRRWFGDERWTIANGLLAAQGGVASAESGRALWRLAMAAAARPEVRDAVLASLSFAAVAAQIGATETGRSFLRDWDQFMEAHGHHARGEIELATPRWSETPDQVLALLRRYMQMQMSGTTGLLVVEETKALEQARLKERCEAALGPLRRAVFRFLVDGARRGSALRENMKSELVCSIALMRRVLLAIGERLTARGVLATADDVFFLEQEELAHIVEGTVEDTVERDAPDMLRARIVRRRRTRERQQALAPPPVVTVDRHGRASAPPAASDAATPDGTTRVLRGISVSPGCARGRARVILHEGDDEVLPGEILVAPFTDPGWTPYFVPAAGIVVDMGGLLSHGSIIAREYGIPAVVNVGRATELIATGQLIEVDAGAGEVRIVEPDHAT